MFLSIMEKQGNSHTTSYICCRVNNYLAKQDNVVQGSHSELGLPLTFVAESTLRVAETPAPR